MKNCHALERARVAMAPVLASLIFAAAAAEAQLIPAPSGGAAPTIVVSPDHGPPGAPIAVSGVVPPGAASGVRVQWLVSPATEPVLEVGLAGDAYSANLAVPTGAPPGVAQLCVGLTDVAVAELACAEFVIDEPAPGRVEGKLPGGVDTRGPPDALLAVTNPFAATKLQLVTSTGVTVATTVPAPNGSFAFPSVPPGSYTMIQGGAGGKGVASTSATVTSGAVKLVKPVGIIGQMFCGTDNVPTNINNMRAQPTAAAANAHFGTYFSGVQLPVQFWLTPEDMFVGYDAQNPFLFPPDPEQEFSGIEYEFRNPQGQVVDRIRGSGVRDVVSFDVGRLPPGISTVTPYPVANGELCLPLGFHKFTRTIRVVANPLDADFIRADSTISWRGGSSNDGFYRFNVIAPEIPGLPLSFPDPPLTQVPGTSFPLPIIVRNEFDARTILRAETKLNGDTVFREFAAGFEIVILNTTVLDEEAGMSPPGNIRINFLEPRKSSFDINVPSLLPIRQEFTIYEGTVFDLFGLVQVIGALTAGFQGDVGLFTTVQPFVPNLSVRVIPEVAAIGSVSAGLGALNFISGGARLNTRIGIAVPFLVRTDPFFLGAENPCGILQASAELFVRLSAGPITLLRISSPSYPIVLPAGIPLYFPPPFCSIDSGLVASLAALDHQVPLALDDTLDDEPSPLPAVNPAPAVAVSSNGERLRVYVDDATAGTDTITPRIVAQLQNGAGEWGPLLPITDGGHWVAEPVVAWAGTGADRVAVATWTERPTTLAEDIAIDDDIAALLNRQEIYLATFQGGVWSAPVRLTNDLLADGSASIAGDATGYTLAWTFDQDGNPATRLDARLKVRETLLPAATTTTILTSDAMSVDPSVVRRNGESIVAFTKDFIANGIDEYYRTIAITRGSAGTFNQDIYQLPYFADSPSLAITADGREWIGFLQRGTDEGGGTIGSFGTRARVYSATRPGPSTPWLIWSTSNDDGGDASDARGESPLMLASGNDARMVFRSFELNSPNFGQLMVARVSGDTGNTFRAITSGDKQRWFPSAAVDPTTGEVVVVSLDLPGLLPSPDDYALITTEISGVADPALVRLEVEPPHANPGQLVTVRATLRNRGLATTANDLVVDFLDGPPGTGQVLATEAVGTAINLVGFGTAFGELVAGSGPQRIWARVRTSGGNGDPANDVLSVHLRTLPAPRLVQVNAAQSGLGALEVSWVGSVPSSSEGPEPGEPEPPPTVGYRIERSDSSGGPLELAGEATSTSFRDALLQVGQTYCYVVTAYDSTGVVSPPSEETCANAPVLTQAPGVALAGASIRIADNPAKPTARAIAISGKDAAIGLGLVPGSATDPVLHGATLRVGSSSGDSFDGLYELPARNWKALVKRGVTTGFKYTEKDRENPAGPVKTMVVNLGKNFRVSARGAGILTSLQADPGPVNVVLSFGAQSYCLQFGGKAKHTPGKSFSATKAPPPQTCPILPGG